MFTNDQIAEIAKQAGMSVNDESFDYNGSVGRIFVGGSDYPVDDELMRFALALAEAQRSGGAS
jgi:hypothetical protein